MRTVVMGGLETRIIGELDEAGLVVVLLHGFGAPGTDLVPLADYLDAPADTAFVFPAAPLELPAFFGDSRAWFMIDIAALERDLADGRPRDRSGSAPEGIEEARALIVDLLDDLRDKHGVAPGRVVIGGFSQGAMVACDVVLRSERPFAGLVIWSGTLLAKDEWTELAAKRSGLPVVQSHGEADPLLPFFLAEELRDMLRDQGLNVKFKRFAGAHEIPPEALEMTGALLRKLEPTD